MKSLDLYIEDKIEECVEERLEKGIINLDKKGFSLTDIAETLNVNLDFVKKKHYPNKQIYL